MDAVNFKTNIIGRDGFVWWIGQIAPEEVWIENFGISTEESPKWGQRYKVRIMGYHPYSTAELDDKELPWAQVLNPAGKLLKDPASSNCLNAAVAVLLKPPIM